MFIKKKNMSNICAKKVTRNKTLKTIFTLECIIPLWLNVNPYACTVHEHCCTAKGAPSSNFAGQTKKELKVLLMAAFNL